MNVLKSVELLKGSPRQFWCQAPKSSYCCGTSGEDDVQKGKSNGRREGWQPTMEKVTTAPGSVYTAVSYCVMVSATLGCLRPKYWPQPGASLEPVSHLCSRDGSCIEAALVVTILNTNEIHGYFRYHTSKTADSVGMAWSSGE